MPVTFITPAIVEVPLAAPCRSVPFAAPIDICWRALSAVVDAYGRCDATVLLVALKLVAVGEDVATTFPCPFVASNPLRIFEIHKSVVEATLMPVMLFAAAATEPESENAPSEPNLAVVPKMFVDDAVPENSVVVVAPEALILANALMPMNVLFL